MNFLPRAKPKKHKWSKNANTIYAFIFLATSLIILGSATIIFMCFAQNAKSSSTTQSVAAHPLPPLSNEAILLESASKTNATPIPTAEPTPTPIPTYTARMTIVGDLMVHSWQIDHAYKKGGNSFNFDYCFASIKDYLSAADFTVGNLETTFAGAERAYSDYPIFNTPDEFGFALKKVGFDLVSTANNHCNDKGEAGIIRTIDMLDEIGIDHIGTYKSAIARDDIYIKEINNIKFVFLSYTYGTNGILLPAGKDYLTNYLDMELVANDISRAKELEPDFIVVLPHMGNEYEQYPRDMFKEQIHSMLEAGADIVIASHPHVLQPTEFVEITDADGTVRQCFVAYSMGNFVSSQRTIPRDEGAIFNFTFEKTGEEKATLGEVSYIPTWVKFVDLNGGYDIKVLSVYNALKALEKGEQVGLRAKDIARLKAVHGEVTSILQGEEIPLDEMENEYYLKRSSR